MENYRFSLGQRAMLCTSRQSGQVIARAEWITGRRAYLLKLDHRIAGKDEYWHNEPDLTEEE